MKLCLPGARRVVVLALSLSLMGLWVAQSTATAQQKFVVTPIAEKRLNQLPAGQLYWRFENFPTLDQAKAVASKYRWNPDMVSDDGWPSMTAEVAGKAWLFALGQKGAATPGGTKVDEIGPVPSLSAPEYQLRVNYGSAPPGAKTPVHSHFGERSCPRDAIG
jgi:hypothetical protein